MKCWMRWYGGGAAEDHEWLGYPGLADAEIFFDEGYGWTLSIPGEQYIRYIATRAEAKALAELVIAGEQDV